jgi:hypothetical protein
MNTLALLAALATACSGGEETTSGGGTGGSGGVDDGKLHPEPNGVAISEEEACNLLQGTFQQRVTDLGCGSTTVRTCPGFVRVTYDPDCVQYDQGSVQGCVDHWNSITFCEKLVEDDCVATVYPGTEPAGCPGQ